MFDVAVADRLVRLDSRVVIVKLRFSFGASNNQEQTEALVEALVKAGVDVVIDDFAGNSITILNVSLGDMNNKDFIF